MITSTDNSQIKQIIALQQKARERKKQGLFVVEGPRMVRETPERYLKKIYLEEDFLTRFPKEEAWIRAFRGETETVSRDVMRKMSDTRTPQGILGVVRMPEYDLEDLLSRKDPMFLLLEDIQDPGNLGTMIRTAEGAGATALIMSKNTVDIFNPKTVRSTMGALYRMPFLYAEDFEGVLGRLKEKGIALYAAHLGGTLMYDEPDYTGPVGFLVGNEGNGLSDPVAALADTKMLIPMEGQLESLNAAVSAGILMYEAFRQRRRR